MKFNYILVIIVIVAIVAILLLSFDNKAGLCEYIRSGSGSQILNALKVMDVNLFLAKREHSAGNINSYLKSEGFSQGQVDEFHSFLCDTDFSVLGVCGLKDREVGLLKYVKGITCPLWNCKTCCDELDMDISGDDFLLNAHHPLECAIAAKEKGYRGFAVIKVESSTVVECYGTNNVETCAAPPGGCQSVSCGLPDGCFGLNDGRGCSGGKFNRTGKTQASNNYSVYCMGSTQEELDDCMNA